MKKLTKYVLLTICILGLTIAGIAFWKVNQSLSDFHIDTDSAITKDTQADETPDTHSTSLSNTSDLDDSLDEAEDFYALLIGLDYRTGSYTLNTDTIIVAHIIPQDEKVKLISLPRDLRIFTQDGETRKINALFYDGYAHAKWAASEDPDLLSGKEITLGGWTVPEEYFSSGMVHLRGYVEDIFNIEIEHSFLIHFETLIQLVDAVGGIEVNVDRSMQYDDPTDNTHIYFEPGLQQLDGEQALNYARFRQDNRGPAYYSNDFERAQRQQQIITAIAKKMTSWSSISRVAEILDVISNSMKTDMGKSEMWNFVTKYYDNFNGDFIESIPFEGEWQYPYVVISEDELHQIRETFVSVDNIKQSS